MNKHLIDKIIIEQKACSGNVCPIRKKACSGNVCPIRHGRVVYATEHY